MANVTFENCCTNFLTEVRRTRTVSTADTYKYRLTGVLQEFGGKTLREITQEEIQAFFDNNMKGYATKTVRSTFDVLCAIFRQAQRRGIIDSNPCDKVIIPEVVRHQPCVLSKKEVEDVLSKANEEGEEMYLPLLIVAETGIRRSQALALCWQDIDFDSCKITVARNVINHRKNIFSEGKERRTRTISMSPRLSSTLFGVKAKRLKQGKAEGSDFVCLTVTGKVLEPNYFDKCFRRFVQSSPDIPDNLRVHDFRWSFINQRIEAGENPKDVADMVGHSSCVFTLDYYYKGNEMAA